MSKAPAWVKKSLFLPKSSFQPRPNPSHYAGLIKKCSDDIYAWQRVHRAKAPQFILQDGPPYANGDLHIGHALNKILKDVECRFQLGQGKGVQFVPGWDCHGLPIELKAVKELEKKGTAHGQDGQEKDMVTGQGATARALEMRQAARKLASSTIEKQKKQFRSWGVMADWENPWKTLNKDYEIKQLEVFKGMVAKGLIYRRFMPVYWSPSTRTALAEAELEYRDDHVSTAAYVRYKLSWIPRRVLKELSSRSGSATPQLYCVIWTTQPWTLPANRAIGYSTKIEYSVVAGKDGTFYIVAQERLGDFDRLTGQSHTIVMSMFGPELDGANYIDNVWTTDSETKPLLSAEHVTADGTGFAHLAPGHGLDDYRLCLKNGINPVAPVDESGAFDATACPRNPELLAGKPVANEGTQAVLEHVEKHGQLIKSEKYVHKYPYDWRSKQPVILRATAQWFADVGDLRQKALVALNDPQLVFVPAKGKDRLSAFVKTRNEWCISRQRAWGVPIPALYHIENEEALMNEHSIEHIVSVVQEQGIDSWWSDLKTDPKWTPPWHRELDGSTKYRRGTDTMDVWFDSGTSWTQTTDSDGQPRQSDVYLEGSDQHRGWFQSSLLTFVAHQKEGKAPFKSLVTHGFVLDGQGKKMSKSEGNVIAPPNLIDGSLLPPINKKVGGEMKEFKDSMGPDALRLWAATCDFTEDVRLSVESLKAVNSTLAKLRVTFKLLLGLLQGFDPHTALLKRRPHQSHQLLAIWHLQQMHTEYLSHCRNHQFHKALDELVRYVNVQLSASYIDTIKDAAYCGTAEARGEVQSTIAIVLNVLLRDLAPITPLLAQEVWDALKAQDASGWFVNPFKVSVKDDIVKEYDLDRERIMRAGFHSSSLSAMVDATRKAQELARMDKKMGSSLESDVTIELVDDDSSATKPFFDIFGPCLAEIMVVSQVNSVQGPISESRDWSYSQETSICGQRIIVHVHQAAAAKCVRCWRYLVAEPTSVEESLCSRCETFKPSIQEAQSSEGTEKEDKLSAES